jgi:mRNA-degrading endonuclease RelE of RelBE toxin-antitoxin system
VPYSQEVIADHSLSAYESQVSVLMEEGERSAMEFHAAIPGLRKPRWGRIGHGKSSGYRVIYFFLAEPGSIYLASIYAKSRRTLSQADRNVLSKLAARIKSAGRGG